MATAVHDIPAARQSSRKRVLLRASLYTPEGAFNVHIRDISNTGAQVFGDTRLPSGCDIVFKRGETFAAGRIAWSSETAAGITFYRELSDAEVSSAALPIRHHAA